MMTKTGRHLEYFQLIREQEVNFRHDQQHFRYVLINFISILPRKRLSKMTANEYFQHTLF